MRKPSAALVVATAALVMATIGTSVAATGFTITSSKQIKPGSISLQSLSKSARKALRATQGPPGQDGQDGQDGEDGFDGQDGLDGLNATDLWAQIGNDASVNASGGGVTARAMGTGIYLVNFGQDITHCAVVATQASLPNFTGAGLSTTGTPGAAFVVMSNTGVDLAAGFPSQMSVRVQTNRANGPAVSTNFTIAAFC
jgi:hypothetical protein